MNTQEQNEACVKAAAALGQLQGTAGYVAYCRNRIAGLRKAAFQELEVFLETAQQWDFVQKKAFVAVLSALAESIPSGGYGPCPSPLMQALVLPTLREWAETSVDGDPLRWWGMFTNDVKLVEAALARNRSDHKARIRIVASILKEVEYETHHLPDVYLGEPRLSLERLEAAKSHLQILDNGLADVGALREEFEQMRTLVQDWIDSGGVGREKFLELCRQRQRQYSWGTAYYYSTDVRKDS